MIFHDISNLGSNIYLSTKLEEYKKFLNYISTKSLITFKNKSLKRNFMYNEKNFIYLYIYKNELYLFS